VTPSIPDRRRIVESTSVLITALGKFLFMDVLQWRLPFILCTVAAWSAYVYWRWKSNPTILRYWGFRTDNFGTVLRQLLPLGLIAVATFLTIGYFRDTLNITWHIIPILLTYPIWGAIQQFLCVGLVAGNMQDMTRPLNRNVIVLITAIFFSLLHYPNVWLMAGTFVLALVYSAFYLRERSLYALGLFHGWLGALFYYAIVGRDPFMEVFGPMLK
jgi:membrane protease YdiL (CAAX protease family)